MLARNRPLSVLITGTGNPGFAGAVHALRANPDGRPLRLVSADANPDAVGRHLVDAFETVPLGTDPDYLDAMLGICERHDVGAILPTLTAELGPLASARDRFRQIGAAVAVSPASAIERANDKAALHEVARTIGVPDLTP